MKFLTLHCLLLPISTKNRTQVTEKLFELAGYNQLDIYGANDKNINTLRELFPKLKIISRDDTIKVQGDDSEIERFSGVFSAMLVHFDSYGKISGNDVRKLSESAGNGERDFNSFETNPDVLIHGRSGILIKARTPNQQRMVDAIATSDMILAIGPAGTGKTYTAVALAVRALKNKEVRRIILTRPAVEAGENLGFLPGDLKDKLDPYLQPLYDALRDMVPSQKLVSYLEDGTIEIAPLAFMRGRTLENSFAILDEAQNSTEGQLKMFLTRMGRNSKFVITGDITQIDLPRNQNSGLVQAAKILKEIKGIEIIQLDERDVVRHKLVTSIIHAYDNKDKSQS